VATLSELSIPEGELSPVFNSTIYNYTIDILESETEITILATPTDSMAKVFGDGTKALSSGTNYFTIVVIAEDGVTSSEYNLTIHRILSIDEPMAELQVLIYPNPTTGELRVTSYELQVTNVEVYDIFGKKHERAKGRKDERAKGFVMDISHLPAGSYFVKIITERGEIVKKVVKY
jgi:hypothetical protein